MPDAISKVLAKHVGFRVNGKVEDKITVPVHADAATTNGHATEVTTATEKVSQAAMNQLSLPETGMPLTASAATSLFDLCPECGSGTLAYEEGCKKCYGCGYSEC